VLGGFGATAGAALPNNSGYDWNGPHVETWGENTIEGDVENDTNPQGGINKSEVQGDRRDARRGRR